MQEKKRADIAVVPGGEKKYKKKRGEKKVGWGKTPYYSSGKEKGSSSKKGGVGGSLSPLIPSEKRERGH